MSLEGKVIVITGSTRGIGRSIADAVAARGARVVVSSRSEEAVAAQVSRIVAAGGTARGVTCDVADAQQVESLLARANEAYGATDIWVNNAGISEGYRPLDELSPDELRELTQINLLGHLYGCREALRYFRDRRRGYLMNMTGRGYRGEATPHTAAYAATKTAIASLTRSLAAENRDMPGISVNAIVPGMVDTDFYVDIKSSPRLESTKENWRYALDAFGVPIELVGAKAADILAEEPGRVTGRIYSFISGGQSVRGIAKMAWWGMTGKLGR